MYFDREQDGGYSEKTELDIDKVSAALGVTRNKNQLINKLFWMLLYGFQFAVSKWCLKGMNSF